MDDASNKVAEMKGIPTQEQLNEQLRESVLVVTFDKKDGSERVMTCTKNLDVIPKEDHPTAGGKTPPEFLITVWDTNAQGWRSFYYDKVKKVEEPSEE